MSVVRRWGLGAVLLLLAGAAGSALAAGAAPVPGPASALLPLLLVPGEGPGGGAAFVGAGPGFRLALDRDGLHQWLEGPGGGEHLLLEVGGAGRWPEPRAEDPVPVRLRWYQGRGVPRKARAYRAVRVEGVLPGVDLRFYGRGRELEYDVVLAPGRKVSGLRLRWRGVRALRLGPRGELVLALARGELVQRPPVAYQLRGGRREPVEARYVLHGDGSFGCAVEGRDPALPLVIDPVLAYSSYLGGGDNDHIYAAAADATGRLCVAGYTMSPDFPLQAPWQGTVTGLNETAFVACLDPTGASLSFATYLGGSGEDEALALAVDEAGAVYVAGYTDSPDFPVTPGAFQATGGGTFTDGFVAKLDASGALAYATYLGGSDHDRLSGVAVDARGRAWVTGTTLSPDYPTARPLFTGVETGNHRDGVLSQLSADGATLLFSTYLGGSGRDAGVAVALGAGDVFVTGETESADFPVTAGAYQTTPFADYVSVFVARMRGDGSGLVYATYLSGEGDDHPHDIAVDATGAAVVVGQTLSPNFPVAQPLYTDASTGNHRDAFVVKLTPDGGGLVYGTYLGGGAPDGATAVALDAAGAAVVVGWTRSPDFPVTPGAPRELPLGGQDAFLVRLDPEGTSLLFGTYLGGSADDTAHAVDVDGLGVLHVAGDSWSADLGLAGALQPDPPGPVRNGFVMRLP